MMRTNKFDGILSASEAFVIQEQAIKEAKKELFKYINFYIRISAENGKRAVPIYIHSDAEFRYFKYNSEEVIDELEKLGYDVQIFPFKSGLYISW